MHRSTHVSVRQSNTNRVGNRLQITTAGWNTVTTRERLNGLPNVSVIQRKGKLYLNGKEWDGEWIEVK